jgi:hypothetical protein
VIGISGRDGDDRPSACPRLRGQASTGIAPGAARCGHVFQRGEVRVRGGVVAVVSGCAGRPCGFHFPAAVVGR